MEVDGNYVIAAITGVSEDGIAPLETVSPQIVSILREQKKGEILAQEMTGSSLAEVASKLNLEVKEAANIDFNSFYIESVGVEPKLIGAVTGAKENTLSKPVAGQKGVFLFDVTSRAKVDNVTPESEKGTPRSERAGLYYGARQPGVDRTEQDHRQPCEILLTEPGIGHPILELRAGRTSKSAPLVFSLSPYYPEKNPVPSYLSTNRGTAPNRSPYASNIYRAIRKTPGSKPKNSAV